MVMGRTRGAKKKHLRQKKFKGGDYIYSCTWELQGGHTYVASYVTTFVQSSCSSSNLQVRTCNHVYVHTQLAVIGANPTI